MTKINRISIHGFKSFAHKTEIPFDGKFNCILGPNGSGKSNIGDAICFVLGRISAKSMRAERTANLIFNGGKKSKAGSSGSVEIAFCNRNKIFPKAENEVVVNRAINNDGTSTYRVNGKKHTRTEVLDLLGHAKVNPNGYNIILQGDITHFVDMPSVERRKTIEEISDVTVYEEKKHKAMLELEKVEEKLNNAEIILKERKTYLKELKKDRDQALQFKELKDRIDSSKATFLHLQIEEREAERAKADKEIGGYQDKLNSAEKKIIKLKEGISCRRESISDINKQIELKGEKEQVRVHKEIEDLRVDLAKEKARISTLKDEISKIQLRRDQFGKEISDLEEKTASQNKQQRELLQSKQKKQSELKELEKSLELFKKKNKIESSQELEHEIEELDKQIEQKQDDIQQIRQKQQGFLRDKDRLEYQLQSVDERIRKVKEVEKENKEQIRQLQQMKSDFKSATLRLNQSLDADSSFASQLANARNEFTVLQEKQAALNAKTMSLQAGLARNEALKSIMNNKKLQGVYGMISQLGKVNRKFALPLETAAGSKMQHIVVENDKIAAECIRHLKSCRSGTASFIPLNKIKGKEITSEDKKLLKLDGVHDFAQNVISFQPRFRKAFEYVFGNTLIVEDIDKARQVGVGRIKMATLDGNLAESSGVMRGGFRQRNPSAGFQEEDSLKELETVEKRIFEVEGVMANVRIKREANEKEISSLRNRKAELEGEMIKLEKTLHLDSADMNASASLKAELNTQLKEVELALAQVQKDIVSINKELTQLKSSKQNLRSQVSELRSPRLLAQLTAFEESRHKCREDLMRIDSEIKTSSLQVEQMYSPELDKIKEIIKQIDKDETEFSMELQNLSASVEKRNKELELKEKASKEFYIKYKELFNQREGLNTEINKLENEIEAFRESMRADEKQVNLISLKNAEVKAKLAGLDEEFKRFKDIPILNNKTPEELHKEIAKFEVMLGQMSTVNMKALEVYEQIEKEYNNLVNKKAGLEREKTDVLTLMNEVETKKKDHFLKTFNSINTNFQKIFQSLFKKGKAYLQLDNADKPFEDGMSIKVKLTGKRFMDIKSLSGGEKTLTALSFIFAIQEHQPASFYILDEIDAALDKHNSETLAKLVRSYADNAQYVVISHNDSLISEADTLFGVSMNDGISKVTSLKI